MVLETILSTFGAQSALVILILFIIFVFVVKRLIKVIISAVWIGIVSALFPVFLRYVLGMHTPLTALSLDTFLFWITLGLGIYSVFLLGKIIYSVLGVFGKMLSPLGAKARKEKKLDMMLKKGEKMEEERKKDKSG